MPTFGKNCLSCAPPIDKYCKKNALATVWPSGTFSEFCNTYCFVSVEIQVHLIFISNALRHPLLIISYDSGQVNSRISPKLFRLKLWACRQQPNLSQSLSLFGANVWTLKSSMVERIKFHFDSQFVDWKLLKYDENLPLRKGVLLLNYHKTYFDLPLSDLVIMRCLLHRLKLQIRDPVVRVLNRCLYRL